MPSTSLREITAEFYAIELAVWDLHEPEKGTPFPRWMSSPSGAHGLVSGSQAGFLSLPNPSIWFPSAVNNLYNQRWQPYHTIRDTSCIFIYLLWFLSQMWLEFNSEFWDAQYQILEQSWTPIFCLASENTSKDTTWKEADDFQTKPSCAVY